MRARLGSLPALLVGWVCLFVSASGAALAAGQPAHYLVFEVDENSAAVLVFHRRVVLSSRPASRSQAELDRARSAAASGTPVITLELIGRSGEAVHRDVVQPPEFVRGEFHGEPEDDGGWSIDSYRVPPESSAFVVRVPAIPGARLHLGGHAHAMLALDGLPETPDRLPPHRASLLAPATEAVSFGNPANRVDLVIMGDGYTAAQEAEFLTDATDLENAFFGVTPFDEYRNLVNVTALFTASAESGADHPPYDASCTNSFNCCKDSAMQNDHLQGTFVDTAIGGRYCTSHIHRLLVVSTSAVLAAASAVPEWDKIIVMVHDSTYGGSGGSLSVTSTHSSAVEIARHEYGHSFGRLADEYDSAYPGFSACSDVTSPACEANVTDETDPVLTKWAPWILPTTPLPTPETSTYNNVVGLFEGARYRASGMYRPRRSECLMRALNLPFCEVCRQAYVLKLYSGGWGTPASGIDLIEPGTETPPTADPVDGTGGITLSVDLLQPMGGPTLGVTWKIDGIPQPGPGTNSFFFAPPGPGTYVIEIEVEDVTPFVHPAMSQGLTITNRSWTVHVTAGPDPGELMGNLTVESAATPGNLILSWPASCSAATPDYAIYEGTIGDFTSHTALTCTDTAPPLSEEITPGPGSTYYLIVPLHPSAEGSYGRDSAAAERPPATLRCIGATQLPACP